MSLLPRIFPEYEYVVLDKVYNELSSVKNQLDNHILCLRNITKLDFKPTLEMMREYAALKSRFGDGESACMAYCRYTANIIGSSNLRDIKSYCVDYQITFLTTMDFIYYAWQRKLMTEEECIAFIADVTAKGSKLPKMETIIKYVPSVAL